jgi:anaerobic selenocysteine-containing dehydrogenase
VIRACALLPAVTGNLGKPGAGFLYLNWNFNAPYRYLDDAYLTASHLAPSPPPRLSHMDLAACLEAPQRTQALVCWNINIAASNPEQARLRRALTREDLFTVVVELFPTDTTDFADIVLPAASFLEFDDLVAGMRVTPRSLRPCCARPTWSRIFPCLPPKAPCRFLRSRASSSPT